jgi:hypothetical protein
MAFVDLLGFAGETLEVNIIAVITLSYFIAFAKSLISLPLGKNKKIAASAMVSPSLLAAILGWIWLFWNSFFSAPEICRARSIFRKRPRCPA